MDWDGVSVEAEYDLAEWLRFGAAGEVGLTEGAAEEVCGADAEIEEQLVGDSGVGFCRMGSDDEGGEGVRRGRAVEWRRRE